MATLLLVWQSTTGGAEAMAQAAAAAARAEDVEVRVREAAEADPEDLVAADGFLFATPEYLAAIGGRMKDFFDRSYYSVLGRIEGRPYAQMVCAGSDGTNAARQLARIATGWRLRAVADPLIVRTDAQTPEAILRHKTIADADLARCRDLGAAIAAGLAMGVF